MRSLKLGFLSFLFLTLSMPGCKTDTGKKEDGSTASDGKSFVEVVEFEVLKDALPETMAGLKRTSHTGQKSSLSNMQISNAQAEYSDGSKRINATITDTGGLSSLMAVLAPWAELDMKNETQDGFQRTTTIYGHKAFEKYSKESENAEISMIYNERFVITLNGYKVSVEELREVAGEMKIKG